MVVPTGAVVCDRVDRPLAVERLRLERLRDTLARGCGASKGARGGSIGNLLSLRFIR